jgi:hypothetical protein
VHGKPKNALVAISFVAILLAACASAESPRVPQAEPSIPPSAAPAAVTTNREVRFGEQTHDEMFVGMAAYRVIGESVAAGK